MNARPHRSRQRCDWTDLGCLKSIDAANALKTLLEKRKIEFPAKVPVFESPPYPEAEWSEEQKQARDAHQKQTKLLKKLRDVADDALEYMNDHGESCLALGFPLISMPPAADEKSAKGSSRVLAPLLLMPVNIQVRTASRAGVSIECVGEGADLLVANPALVAWLERQTGRTLGDIYLDDDAADPWREVDDLLQKINTLLDLPAVAQFHADTPLEPVPPLEKLPKSVTVLPSAVLGLFPLSNQSLLRDTRWMMEHQAELQEPVSAFLNPKALHDTGLRQPISAASQAPQVETEDAAAPTGRGKRAFAAEWLVSNADPCQANAVLVSREAKALVVHGPPGTGKSQTITNMIADHLARGERVLFVCDKRTALDVVKYRLDAVGLGGLCGVVHDPGSDRKDFYMGLRGQLENLADAPPARDPGEQLASVNQQLAAIHAELEGCRQKLHADDPAGGDSFHALLGAWLGFATRDDLPAIAPLPGLQPTEVEAASTTLDEICRRADKAAYPTNPFRGLLGITLNDFLARSTSDTHATLEAIHASAQKTDEATPATLVTLCDPAQPLTGQAAQREGIAAQLRTIIAGHEEEFLHAAASTPAARRNELTAEAAELNAWLGQMNAATLDRALLTSARGAGVLTLEAANRHLAALTAWEAVAGSFFKRLLAGAAKKAAAAALLPLGLGLDSGWQQGLAFYKGIKTRLLVADWLGRVRGGSAAVSLADDATLQTQASLAQTAWAAQAAFTKIGGGSIPADKASLATLAEALEAEARWLRAMDSTASQTDGSGLFSPAATATLIQLWISPARTQDTTAQWLAHATTLEDMVRLRHALGLLPPALSPPVEKLVAAGEGTETVLACLRRQAVENGLRGRLRHDPELAAIDGDRIEAAFENFLKLSQEKLQLVGAHIRFIWLSHQRSRLLATTGTQLNKVGSGLRQRLYVKGKKALKLRQMLATGTDAEGGDPIYDLCPVWMASPSTVAQIFPRLALFDVVIFDEASQCRLEEALPVLLRGHRVVIAGDQKQLPPHALF